MASSLLQHLPEETLSYILEFCTSTDLAWSSATCKSLHLLAKRAAIRLLLLHALAYGSQTRSSSEPLVSEIEEGMRRRTALERLWKLERQVEVDFFFWYNGPERAAAFLRGGLGRGSCASFGKKRGGYAELNMQRDAAGALRQTGLGIPIPYLYARTDKPMTKGVHMFLAKIRLPRTNSYCSLGIVREQFDEEVCNKTTDLTRLFVLGNESKTRCFIPLSRVNHNSSANTITLRIIVNASKKSFTVIKGGITIARSVQGFKNGTDNDGVYIGVVVECTPVHFYSTETYACISIRELGQESPERKSMYGLIKL